MSVFFIVNHSLLFTAKKPTTNSSNTASPRYRIKRIGPPIFLGNDLLYNTPSNCQAPSLTLPTVPDLEPRGIQFSKHRSYQNLRESGEIYIGQFLY